jgi:hypothetical protein
MKQIVNVLTAQYPTYPSQRMMTVCSTSHLLGLIVKRKLKPLKRKA